MVQRIFNHHPQEYGLPLLRQMLPVLTNDPEATAWLGNVDESSTSPR
jgi:hypothetical protein